MARARPVRVRFLRVDDEPQVSTELGKHGAVPAAFPAAWGTGQGLTWRLVP